MRRVYATIAAVSAAASVVLWIAAIWVHALSSERVGEALGLTGLVLLPIVLLFAIAAAESRG